MKWRLRKAAKLHSFVCPPPDVILAKIEEERALLLACRQAGRTQDAATVSGKIEALEWFMNYGV